jgi:rhodanese-related sulfurtransferase
VAKRIDADRVIRLVAAGAPLLDVLPNNIYQQEHLPGAVSVPLETFTPSDVAMFAKHKPIITYCFDQHCDLSSRAACRLEEEGFTDVYDLIGGRATWTALELPTEGSVADRRRIGQLADAAGFVPFGATVGDARALKARYPIAVVNDDGILLGAISDAGHRLPATTPVVRAMIPAPATIRPDTRVEDAVQQLRKDKLDHVFVTTVGGALIGLVRVDELHV